MAAHKSVFINKIKTPLGRFAFPHLAKPDTQGVYPDDKYKVTLLIPKDRDITGLKKAIMECAREAWPKKKNLKPGDMAHLPIRDGDAKVAEDLENDKAELEGYRGCYFITAKSKRRIRVLDSDRNDIDPEEAYGGAHGRLVVTAMSYEQGGKPGVTFLLDLVQKTADDTPFGGSQVNPDILDDGEVDEYVVADGPDSDEDDGDDWLS